MRKNFLCVLVVLMTVLCFAGCQQNSDTTQAETTGSEIQQTTTAAEETEQTSEFSETSETEISEENTEPEAEPEESVPYILDPEIVFTLDCYEDESYINQPMFVSRPEGSDSNVYVMLVDESSQWEHYEYMLDKAIFTSEYVIIEHDGVIDEIPCRWTERFREPFTVYSGDYDGDGETEIAVVRYAVGGIWCHIEELSVFKMSNGHYQCYTLDNMEILDKYISYKIDNESHTVEFTLSGLDSGFTVNTKDYFDEEVSLVRYGDAVEFYVDGDNITIGTCMFLYLSGLGMPFIAPDLDMKVNFADGEFTCSEPVFEISEY